MFLGTYGIDEYVSIPAATHRFSSGAAYAPTAISYSIYEEGSDTGLDEDVDMTPASPFDAVTGAYLIRRQLTAAAGFEAGKTYCVLIKATVDSVAAIDWHIFQIRAIQTGDSYARLGAPAGASVSADIAAVKGETADILTDTAEIGAAGAGLSAVPWNAAWDAEVESETTDALNAYDPPTKTELDNAIDGLPTAAENADAVWDELSTGHTDAGKAGAQLWTDVDAILADTDELQQELADGGRTDLLIDAVKAVTDKVDTAVELDVDVYRFTQNALEEAPAGSGATAQQVWEYDTRALTDKAGFTLHADYDAAKTAAQAGNQMDLVNAPNATAVTALQNGLATSVELETIKGATWNATTDTLEKIRDKAGDIETDTQDLQTQVGTDGAGLTAIGDTRLANLDAAISTRSTLTAQQVWEYATRTLSSFGTLAADTATAVWAVLTSALTGVGSVGKLIVDNLNATISSRLATSGYTTPPTVTQIRQELDANSTKLANLDGTITSRASQASVDAVDNYVDTEVGAIKAVTDKLNTALELDGAVYRLTENALEQAPSGSLSAPTVEEIRAELDANSAKLANLDTAVSTRAAGATALSKTTWTDARAAKLDNLDAAISSVGAVAGSGAITWTYTVTDSGTGLPIADVDVWVTTDVAGSNVIASGKTDQNGQVTFYLDAGTVYVFSQKSGYTFTNPDTETVS